MHRRAQAGVGQRVLTEAQTARDAGQPLTLVQLYKTFMAGARVKYGGVSAEGAFRAYRQSCASNCTAPEPVTCEKVGGFLLSECLRGLSSHTLTARLSWLLRSLDTHPGVRCRSDVNSQTARREYMRHILALEKEFPGEIRRKEVFTDVSLRQLRAYLSPFLARDSLFAHGFWSMVLLNCAVGCRNKHLRGRAFTWSQMRRSKLGDGTETLILDLPYRKTSTGLRDAQFDAVPVPRRDGRDADLDAVPALARYATLCGKPVDGSGGGGSVFPHRFKKSGRPTDELLGGCSYQQGRRDLLTVLEAAGFSEPTR